MRESAVAGGSGSHWEKPPPVIVHRVNPVAF